jgi:hypothetical protein
MTENRMVYTRGKPYLVQGIMSPTHQLVHNILGVHCLYININIYIFEVWG